MSKLSEEVRAYGRQESIEPDIAVIEPFDIWADRIKQLEQQAAKAAELEEELGIVTDTMNRLLDNHNESVRIKQITKLQQRNKELEQELADYKMLTDATTVEKVVAENQRLRDALERQADNMAFLLNNAPFPESLYDKYVSELTQDRKALEGTDNG